MKYKAHRKYIVRLFLLALVASLIQACGVEIDPEPSCNFVQNSKLQRVSWKGQVAKMYIHQSVPQEYHKTIKDAAEVWNKEVGYKIISIESVVNGSETPTQDGYNIIYWMKNWDTSKSVEQARTTIYWKGPYIYEADMRVNAKNHQYSVLTDTPGGQVDFHSLIVHEMGHVLGLAHVTPQTPSVMHAHLSNGLERRNLTKVDKSSLSCEYGG